MTDFAETVLSSEYAGAEGSGGGEEFSNESSASFFSD
jgi:hypothetical protein